MSAANPFDGELSNARKIFNNISLVVSIVVVTAFVLWVVFSSPKSVRAKFGIVQSKSVVLSQNENEANEFYQLYGLVSQNKHILLDEQFKADFPTAAALLMQDDSTWAYNKPYVIDTAGYFGLALSFTPSPSENINRMDVVLIPYENREGYIHIKPLIRYTVGFHKDFAAVYKEDFRTEQFRLNFYSLQFKFANDINALGFKLKLNDTITEKEIEIYDINYLFTVDDEKIRPNLIKDKSNSYLSYNAEFETRQETVLKISFNDYLYDYFDGMEIALDCSENTEFSIIIN
ncbi:MAG TPA: hypothetical protein GXX17_07225 [Clostridiales bacterium]|nr:hypothetical protein [Clostridiales bacterium]